MSLSTAQFGRAAVAFGSRLAEGVAALIVGVLRLLPIGITGAVFGRIGRIVGPLHPRNRIGLENLRYAFPRATDRELYRILRLSWDNLFRVAIEHAQIDRIYDFDPAYPHQGRTLSVGSMNLVRLRDDGRPGLLFTAHLGNWELLPVAAQRHGLALASLYRAPNLGFVAGLIEQARRGAMYELVPSRPGAVYELMTILERGGHVGLVVDQKFNNRSKVAVEFFGRPAHANPLLAQLARQFDCPVHGARAIRQRRGRHRLELTEEIRLPRDDEGLVDVEKATAHITAIIEGWIREHPEQWLWVHKRWSL